MYQAMWLAPPRSHVLAYWREWLMLDSGSVLEDLTVPTLAVFAVGPDATDAAAMRERIVGQFRRNHAAPVVSVEFIDRATHSIWESQPAAFDRAVAAFCSETKR
jgi:pimeloyl-ACP methyl ester carboxylesterase